MEKRFGLIITIVLYAVLIMSVSSQAASLGSRVLYFGQQGSDVRELQIKLSHWGYNLGVADGDYGKQTERAVIQFQKDQKLRIDGYVGPETINRLLGRTTISYQPAGLRSLPSNSVRAVEGSNSSSSNYIMTVNQEERQLLARAVYSEARGETYKGQVAVASVILNRVKDPKFPNSIKRVIFEPWAFTAVHDGQFWLQPDQTAIRAVEDALKGWDPSGGATFYYNPAKVTSNWIYSRSIIKRIGRHYFAS